ncbi:MAG: hypothetical protein IJA34_04970 [Lachnospiraceae bacterium]|nr:hypothetical protein [Lachnospiraceae bacterium]
MMQRLAVFVFFDVNGIVSEYVCYLLECILVEVKELIVIVNGNICKESLEKLKKYSQKIFFRSNCGFDAGAYKDFFLSNIVSINFDDWDEIIIFNDTFYGPLFSWKEYFDFFENEKVDYWGLSSHPEGYYDINIEKHIQGYFLAIRKSLLSDEEFFEFWEKMEYPENYIQAVQWFEVGFSNFCRKNGYVGKSWTDVQLWKYNYNENPYLHNAYGLINEIRFPVVKKKLFNMYYYDEVKKVIIYIKNNTLYDIRLIEEDVKRMCAENRVKPFNFVKLQEFCIRYKYVYIFGTGIYANAVVHFLEDNNLKYKCYVVSDSKYKSGECILLEELKLNNNEGMIVALGKKNFDEVYHKIKRYCKEEQLFIPDYLE